MDAMINAVYEAIGSADALAKAQEAVAGATTSGDKKMEAQARAALASVHMSNTESDQAIQAAEGAVAAAKDAGDRKVEADALLTLGHAHVASVGKKMGKCTLASVDDSIKALKAAKEAHALYAETGGSEGMQDAMQMVSMVLVYNGAGSDAISSAGDPEQIFQDVMSGRYTHSGNALPPAPAPKQLKLEEVVPSAKQLERGKFSWNRPLEGYSFTLIWQPTKDRGSFQSSGGHRTYDIMGLNTGVKTTSIPALFGARCNDASERNDSLVLHMTSVDTGPHYGADMMSAMNTISMMVTARLSKLTFVQFGESHSDWADTRIRQVHMYPVTLSILRSARIEAPTITIGYVSGDAPSWLVDPAPLIENLFDTIEDPESEVIYRKGDGYAPLMVHRPMDDPVTFVKPKKPNSFVR